MLKEFIDRLLELNRPETVEVNNRIYSTLGLKLVTNPEPSRLLFHSLKALADYIMVAPDGVILGRDEEGEHDCFVYIEDERTVNLVSSLDALTLQRACFATAEAAPCPFKFDAWHSQEQIVVALQAMFVATPERDALLRVVSSITNEAIGTSDDDGVTQQVSVRAGVTLKNRADLPNPVVLRPYRTFREVEQPASAFVLRVKTDGDGVRLALFEADGGTWKIQARENVAAWLREKLGSAPVVLA